VSERSECLFCRIVDGDVPAELVHQGDKVVAFRDIDPVAPTHVLVVSREHHQDVTALAAADPSALAEMVAVADAVSRTAGHDGAHRLVFNTGAKAGQAVFHVHGHVVAGRRLGWPPG
jgi:histidine triad (HIT) family protein